MPEDDKKGATTGTEGKGEGAGAAGQAGAETDQVTMSKADYEKALESETDRRLTTALQTHRQKWEADYKKQLHKEREDAARLAQLTAEEREKELLERSKAELSEKERTLQKREMKLAAIDILTEAGLPITFADQLLGDDADETHARIKAFKVAWHQAIEAEVNERLKGKIPQEGESAGKGGAPSMNDLIRRAARRQP